MSFYDNELKTLQQQIVRKKQLEAMVENLYVQKIELEPKVNKLKAIKLDEQADVERLEGGSLVAFFYNVVGKMDEKMDKERQEAYAARVKYDAAAKELEAVNEEIKKKEEELRDLQFCHRSYEQALQEKAEFIRISGGPKAKEILQLEEQFTYIEGQKKEIQEAISAGTAALNIAESVLENLDSAKSFGIWDLFGGGLFVDITKHNQLQEAQSKVEKLQVQLCHFKTELADITIQADMKVNIDSFMGVADYVFDGMFADWAVMDERGRALEQVKKTKQQIQGVLHHLDEMMKQVEQEKKETKDKLDYLILENVEK